MLHVKVVVIGIKLFMVIIIGFILHEVHLDQLYTSFIA